MELKKMMKAVGLTQTELSKLSGVNLRQINRVVNGAAPLENMTGRNLVAIASALGISVEELLGDGTEVSPLKASDILTAEALRILDPQDIRDAVKVEQASDWSGWRRYPATCARLRERIPDEWWSMYSSRHIGEVMRLLKRAYDDGKSEVDNKERA